MDRGRNTLLLFFIVLGFIFGALAYNVFQWLANNIFNLSAFFGVVLSGWFISGIAGSIVIMTVVYLLSSMKK